MKKRKAFTLVELLVTIAVSAIFMVSIGTAFYFAVVLNDNTLENASMSYKVRTVREYILANKEDKDDSWSFIYDEEERTLTDVTGSKVVVKDAAYIGVNFDLNEDNFLECTITYKLNAKKVNTEDLTFVVRYIDS